MRTKPTCMIWQHLGHEGPGVFGDLLRTRGWQVVTTEVTAPADISPEAEDADLLLILGGPMSVLPPGRHSFLRAEIDCCARRLAEDRPTLGVCLGAQVMAAALGAPVRAMERREIGWFPLQPDAWTTGDSETWGLTARTHTVLHWHGDTFDLPQGAKRLARSAVTANQGFRWERNGYALQFHLEVPAAEIRLWTRDHAKGANEGDSVQTARDIEEGALLHGPDTAANAGIFLNAWLSRLETEPCR